MVYLQLLLSFVKIGFTSFNGMSMIPMIQEEVLRYSWMTDQELIDLLAIAEATPGPLGLNSATFAGMRAAGVPGAITAGIGILLPSFTVGLVAAIFFSQFCKSSFMKHILLGIRPGCVGMLLGTAISIGRSTYFDAVGDLQPVTLAISCICAFCLLRLKWSPQATLLLSAAIGVAAAVLSLLF